MSTYSSQSDDLARAVAAKAARNLKRYGRTLKRDAHTGMYVVSPKAAVGKSAEGKTDRTKRRVIRPN